MGSPLCPLRPQDEAANHPQYTRCSVFQIDTLAEWLRRRPAKPMGSPRVDSNPTSVVLRRAGFSPAISNTLAAALVSSLGHVWGRAQRGAKAAKQQRPQKPQRPHKGESRTSAKAVRARKPHRRKGPKGTKAAKAPRPQRHQSRSSQKHPGQRAAGTLEWTGLLPGF